MNPAIVNYARGGWRPSDQQRMAASLVAAEFPGRVYCFADIIQLPGCPSHEEAP